MKLLTFQDVMDAAEVISVAITKSGYIPDYLIGVATGGLFPLALISKQLNNKNILVISAKSETVNGKKEVSVLYFPEVSLQGKKLILIDDITDSGETLKILSELVSTHYNPESVKTVVLASNIDNSKVSPDFYALEESGEWLKFPWEKEDFTPYPYTKKKKSINVKKKVKKFVLHTHNLGVPLDNLTRDDI